MSGLRRVWSLRGAVAFACAAVYLSGCGMIADKDRIKVAKVRDEYMTRGDLFRVLRDMPDEERPRIETKGDFARVVKGAIDEQLRLPLAQEIEADGTTLVTRKQAMQRFFGKHPEENYQLLYTTADPTAFGMTQVQWEGAREEAELAIDRVHEQMRGEAAVLLRAMLALKEGTLTISEEEYQREHDLRQEELKKPEAMRFLAIRFAATEADAEIQAAKVRQRINAGELFEDVAAEYLAKDKSYILDSDITNRQDDGKFRGFWHNASGSKVGDVVGPVFIPAYELVGKGEAGKPAVHHMPDAYLVFKVIEHTPERELTLDEARLRLAPGILVSKMMQHLRDENGVEVYYEKLPDPSMFRQRTGLDPIRGEL